MKGVGQSIREKIEEILTTGSLLKLRHFQNDPKIQSLLSLSKIWGVGEKTASDLMKKGFRSIADLRNAPNIATILTFQHKIPRSEVEKIGQQVYEAMQILAPGSSCTICGSYRRGKPQSGDVDVLIAPPKEVEELPSNTLSHLIHQLEKKGFLTDHLALPSEYYTLFAKELERKSLPPSSTSSHDSTHDDNLDSLQTVLKVLPGSPMKPNQVKYRSSYMGVCKLEHSIHRRIDIKVISTFNIRFFLCYILQ